MIETAALLDAEALDQEALASLGRAAAEYERLLDLAPSLRDRGGAHHGRVEDRPLIERGPISGHSNPLAAPLNVEPWAGASVVRANVTFGSAYEGPDGMVHGGVLLSAFDEVLALAQLPSGEIGMTGTVTVRLVGPVPIGRRIEFEGGLTSTEGRKAHTWARAHLDGQTLAEATAVCIRPAQAPNVTRVEREESKP